MEVSVLSAQSLKSKDTILFNYFHKSNTDIGIIMETWLSDSKNDTVWLDRTDLNKCNIL